MDVCSISANDLQMLRCMKIYSRLLKKKIIFECYTNSKRLKYFFHIISKLLSY